MKTQIFSILSLVILFSACGSNPDSTPGDSNHKSTTDAAAIIEQAATSSFQVDVEHNQVYLESTGWITAADFWEIYYNDPVKLPGDIDHEELAKLSKPTGAE